jgi:hypothetical protein
MLAELVSLYDVEDVEGFVNATLNRFEEGDLPEWAKLSTDERQELVLEGITIMFELAERFEPHREGYAQAGRFSGYAAAFLPKRLGDAWHRLHPEHRYVTDPETGKRGWVYLQPASSLQGLAEHSSQGGEGADGQSFIEARVLDPTFWRPGQQRARRDDKATGAAA